VNGVSTNDAVSDRAHVAHHQDFQPRLSAHAMEEGMKLIGRIIGVLLALIGCIWILQGINVLPGSFMTGQMQWAIYGAIALVVGVAIFVASGRRRAV
jgi:hypothetical protein